MALCFQNANTDCPVQSAKTIDITLIINGFFMLIYVQVRFESGL